MIILDTNVISELMRDAPEPVVMRWLKAQPGASLFVTTISKAEILYGVEVMPRGKKRDALATEARAMFDEDFAERVLPFGGGAAVAYAVIAAERRRLGRPISTLDAQIAAIARSVDAQLATRDVDDFVHCGIDVIDPWS